MQVERNIMEQANQEPGAKPLTREEFIIGKVAKGLLLNNLYTIGAVV